MTPNKKANSGALAYYRRLQAARRSGGAHYLYEATVGAGLPIVQTLRDLRETGDEIRSIEGIFSGTLAYLFNVYDGTQPLLARSCSEAAPARLHRAGSARRPVGHGRGAQADHSRPRDGPGPRAARREGGEPGADRACRRLDRGVHGAACRATTQPMRARLEAARARGNVLRYVGRLTAGGRGDRRPDRADRRHMRSPTSRSPTTSCASRPAATATTRCIVQGPGAGPEVTAGGVFARPAAPVRPTWERACERGRT